MFTFYSHTVEYSTALILFESISCVPLRSSHPSIHYFSRIIQHSSPCNHQAQLNFNFAYFKQLPLGFYILTYILISHIFFKCTLALHMHFSLEMPNILLEKSLEEINMY